MPIIVMLGHDGLPIVAFSNQDQATDQANMASVRRVFRLPNGAPERYPGREHTARVDLLRTANERAG